MFNFNVNNDCEVIIIVNIINSIVMMINSGNCDLTLLIARGANGCLIDVLFIVADSSTITGPMSLKSYYAVASYKDKKKGFSFNEGDVVQVLQKDPSGWPLESIK